MDDDEGTSAGGDRPKVTVQADGALWIAKLQARGDAAHLPAREFVAMSMARELGLAVPRIRFHRQGRHEVFLIERFDRTGHPRRPHRHLFASAHTVLGLKNPILPADPSRCYPVLADKMRRWIRDEHHRDKDLAELWRRMAYNALVGNKDDHPRNHGLLHDGSGWRLSPLYDVTSLPTFACALSMGVLPDGSQDCSPQNLLRVAPRFGLKIGAAAAWLGAAATHVASAWQQRLRDSGVSAARLNAFEPAFAIAQALAGSAQTIEHALQSLERTAARRGRTGAGRRPRDSGN